MIFEGLAEKLQNTFDKLKGKGKLSEDDVKSALREVKLALLEADVNFKVVKNFIKRLEERAVGEEVLESLTPAQQVIKIVNEELTDLMGGTQSKLTLGSRTPAVVMLVGLQGAGKTTTVGKLAKHLHGQGRSPQLVAADVYRPAAIKQLQVLGERLEQPVFSMGDKQDPVDIAKAAVSNAESEGRDVTLIDTAGRLHIDEELMDELKGIKKAVKPQEILLVVDAMTGQDAVNVAEKFDEALGIDGVILTKLDGDARGGAALSISSVTGKPIKFVGTGEKLDNLEEFHPDRMASRILGMGDVLSLIEKAEESIDAQKAKELEEKLRKEEFTLEDFQEQMGQIRSMGPLDQIMEMLPGMGNLKQLKGMDMNEGHLDQIEAIINSMTIEERRDPQIINGSRRRRIAEGSGTKVQDVNRLLKQFKQTKKMMKQLGDMQKKGMGGALKDRLPFF
ncbi:signal recognition particle protein [Fuchsiella alkaliacetigena]|uniref:signal recognition particle protein n=1 Tax=Fuchsiella alkaliacetigena TaxID=957042 RepID=UPI00200AA588|nr:signal recognition particle protein [Fuchsiella alkaliacetigena]MCK8825859.1 signal recognition particle protein [Fuchsiella alkaliacetigena]